MSETVCNNRLLCPGNAARGAMTDGILNRAGRGQFRAFSDGGHPTGVVIPGATAHSRGSVAAIHKDGQ